METHLTNPDGQQGQVWTNMFIGTIHIFSCINFAWSRGSCLNRRPQDQVFFKRLPRDPAIINAVK